MICDAAARVGLIRAPTSGCARPRAARDLVPTSGAHARGAARGTTRKSCSCRPSARTSGFLLTRTLVDIFGQLVEPDARTRVVPGRSEEARLAVPLVGLDEVIGILLVRSSVRNTARSTCALSVIAAKLAAYITIRGASADLRRSPASATGTPRRRGYATRDELLELFRPSSGSLFDSAAPRPRRARAEDLAQGPAPRRPARPGAPRVHGATPDAAEGRSRAGGDDPSSPAGWKRPRAAGLIEN